MVIVRSIAYLTGALARATHLGDDRRGIYSEQRGASTDPSVASSGNCVLRAGARFKAVRSLERGGATGWRGLSAAAVRRALRATKHYSE